MKKKSFKESEAKKKVSYMYFICWLIYSKKQKYMKRNNGIRKKIVVVVVRY